MQELEKILEEIDREVEEYMEIDFSDEYNAGFKDMAYMAKKIIRKYMNDGWIPAKEKPAEDGFYVATMSGALVDQEEPFVGLAEFEDGEWVDGDDVIAWRLLPELYHPKKESEGSRRLRERKEFFKE